MMAVMAVPSARSGGRMAGVVVWRVGLGDPARRMLELSRWDASGRVEMAVFRMTEAVVVRSLAAGSCHGNLLLLRFRAGSDVIPEL